VSSRGAQAYIKLAKEIMEKAVASGQKAEAGGQTSEVSVAAGTD
jgi:hypothetical protein